MASTNKRLRRSQPGRGVRERRERERRERQRRQPLSWFAIDDDDADWPAADRDRLVRTDGALGISPKDVQARIRAKLATF
ncbi:HAD domain-containing protein [Achromobacter sp. ES-001]|uniref:HAD domain-containing protein n=1 Tax=Achromobacter sp. ES-001 TaxID=2860286 RepID=UPI00351D8C3A